MQLMPKLDEKAKLLKEVYRACKERITLLLNLLGSPPHNQFEYTLNPNDREKFRLLLKAIADSLEFERSEDYRRFTTEVVVWCQNAFNDEYAKACQSQNVSAPYALRRGLDFLQVVMYRDLRRNQVAGEESQRYFIFKELVKTYPPFSPVTGSNRNVSDNS
jgi:hypothetical protein